MKKSLGGLRKRESDTFVLFRSECATNFSVIVRDIVEGEMVGDEVSS